MSEWRKPSDILSTRAANVIRNWVSKTENYWPRDLNFFECKKFFDVHAGQKEGLYFALISIPGVGRVTAKELCQFHADMQLARYR